MAMATMRAWTGLGGRRACVDVSSWRPFDAG
jgi:hypothetical protein